MLLIVAPVARLFPQVGLVHVWRHDLIKATLLVLALDEINQGVVDAGTMREHEGGTWRHLIPEEELLLLANLAVVALGRLLKEGLVLVELLLVWEGDACDSLN